MQALEITAELCYVILTQNTITQRANYFPGEPLIMTGFIRWKVGYPIADEENNCGAFDTGKFLLDNRCDVKLPYICEIPEAP
jgi:hypothetical protein